MLKSLINAVDAANRRKMETFVTKHNDTQHNRTMKYPGFQTPVSTTEVVVINTTVLECTTQSIGTRDYAHLITITRVLCRWQSCQTSAAIRAI
jgi:hypothetical protein